VVFDRHPLWLEGMASLVEAAGLAVAGTARDVGELLVLLADRAPAVLVLGADCSESDCDVIRRARAVRPDVEVVVVGDTVDAGAMRAAFAAGAAVYCLTTAEREDLAAALRESFRRSIYFAASTVTPAPFGVDGELALKLTPRELDILRLVARGWSNPQIAKALWVTQQTVKFHLTNIYRKLDVTNRTEASRWAYVHGLLVEDAAEAPVA
jgi:NarL family two-component system response regulator LiaR